MTSACGESEPRRPINKQKQIFLKESAKRNKSKIKIEQNLFDSIKQRESDKISTNVEKYKESLESLLDLNNEENKLK